MSKLSTEKKEEITELVKKQKRANISWVSKICQIPEETIVSEINNLDLVIEKDEILLPT